MRNRDFGIGRLTRGGLLVLALAGAIGGRGASAQSVASPPVAAASPTVCTAGPPATPADAASGSVATLPTEPAVAVEVNPAGDIPDSQAFVPYQSSAGGYTIAMPEGWARTEDGPNVVFTDKLHRFTVAVTCAATAPTVASVQTVEVPQLTQTIPAFALVGISAVQLPAGPAIVVRYRTNSAPDEVTGKQTRLDVDRYEIYHDGRLAIISLAVPSGSDNVDVANRVSGSFQWTA